MHVINTDYLIPAALLAVLLGLIGVIANLWLLYASLTSDILNTKTNRLIMVLAVLDIGCSLGYAQVAFTLAFKCNKNVVDWHLRLVSSVQLLHAASMLLGAALPKTQSRHERYSHNNAWPRPSFSSLISTKASCNLQECL